jgi:hypothetical protein
MVPLVRVGSFCGIYWNGLAFTQASVLLLLEVSSMGTVAKLLLLAAPIPVRHEVASDGRMILENMMRRKNEEKEHVRQ